MNLAKCAKFVKMSDIDVILYFLDKFRVSVLILREISLQGNMPGKNSQKNYFSSYLIILATAYMK